MTLPAIYTLAEAAERLRLTRYMVARVGRRIGACSQVGRKILFTEADAEAIWQEIRVSPTDR